MVSLARSYISTNRREAAKELLNSVIQIQPDNNEAHTYLGYYYLLLRAQAVKSYQHALQTDSNTPEIITPLKVGAERALAKAIESYKTAIEIDDRDWDAHRQLGVAYILQGTNEDKTVDEQLRIEALEQWRLSLQLRPDQPNREGLHKLVQYYSK